jgi:TP53 regulating kinase-like protein
MSQQKIIQQGAEATILKKGNRVIKRRESKSYRIPEIDEKIRKLRTRSEAKLLKKASEIISIPKIENVDEKSKEIIMEFINGKKLSEHLNKFPLKEQKQICRQIGESISRLHDSNIIHGDLTTSNLLLKGKDVYFIDFGLGFHSHKIEDKAVDLHLLRQALEAKHFKNWKALFNEVLKGYSKKNPKDSTKIIERFRAVERRGRYKDKY